MVALTRPAAALVAALLVASVLAPAVALPAAAENQSTPEETPNASGNGSDGATATATASGDATGTPGGTASDGATTTRSGSGDATGGAGASGGAARTDTVVEGGPDVELSLSDNRVRPGEATALELRVTNTGEIENGSRNPEAEQVVTTARGLSVEPRSGDAPLEVKSGEAALGSLPDGAGATVPVRVQVDEGADPGEYAVPVVVEYRYVEEYNESTGDRETETVRERRTVTVAVERAADFAVESTDSSVGIDDTGPVTFTVENTGSQDLRRASVRVRSASGAVAFDGGEATSVYVGDWAAGETREVTVDAAVGPDAERRPYAVELVVDYTGDDGQRGQSAPLSAGITPGPDQSFAVENATADLRVGEDGTLRGTVANEGPGDVENAVVVLQSDSRTIDVEESEYAVGSLAAGERTNFSFDVEVSDEAATGPRQFGVEVRYERDGDEKQAGPLYVREDVAPARDEFAVGPVETAVPSGGEGEIRLEVTNNRDERVTDVSAKLFGADPVTVDDDEAFVDSLAPGESVTLTFRVSVAGSALAKPYPVSIDFQYDDADGDTRLSDTYRVPVRVTEDGDGGVLSMGGLAVGAVAALALVAGYVVVTRR
ncbi:exo-alpha-sialidase [Halobacteriales archaeon QS_5_70_17]|nr:MAG: exo-alpha-sialidase [Halobacteriales archaeon QS_5_70_17]